jgi:predicted nucleic acid-binding protein
LIGYLDTSALVKLFVLEEGSKAVDDIASRADALATSVVAYAEARASFARLLREGLTTARRHRERVAKLNQDWEDYVRIELTPALSRSSGETAEVYALRGFDSIHLASALSLRGRIGIPLVFAAFDERLRSAAASAGLAVVP